MRVQHFWPHKVSQFSQDRIKLAQFVSLSYGGTDILPHRFPQYFVKENYFPPTFFPLYHLGVIFLDRKVFGLDYEDFIVILRKRVCKLWKFQRFEDLTNGAVNVFCQLKPTLTVRSLGKAQYDSCLDELASRTCVMVSICAQKWDQQSLPAPRWPLPGNAFHPERFRDNAPSDFDFRPLLFSNFFQTGWHTIDVKPRL